MRRVFCIVSVVIFLQACDQPGVDLAVEKAVLEETALGLVTAESARDLDFVMNYWSDDAVAQIEGTPLVEGKDAIRELMRPMLSSFKEFEGRTTHTRIASSGDLAYEYGVNRLVFPGEEADLLGKV